MNKLQLALLANALFSTVTGLLLTIFPASTAALFATTSNTIFLVIGIALLLFAVTVFIEIKRQRPKAVKFIIIQDIVWVLGSIIILLIQPFGLSPAGHWLIGIVAILVLIFALAQYLAVDVIDSQQTKDGIFDPDS